MGSEGRTEHMRGHNVTALELHPPIVNDGVSQHRKNVVTWIMFLL